MDKTHILILLLFLLLSCKSTNKVLDISTEKNHITLGSPPGTVQLDNNIYLDKSEVTNVDWLEYMYWNKRVFGSESQQYINSLPDTNVWTQLDSSLKQFSSLYLRHPTYRYYPLVGITHTQAKKYSQWRSDRVFEWILIKQEIIPYNHQQDSSNYFTRERFYSDEKYKNYHHIPCPDYQLIPGTLWSYILEKADSINDENLKSCKQKSISYRFGFKELHCTELIKNKELVINSIEQHDKGLKTKNPLFPSSCFTCKKPIVFHLMGNVRELSQNSARTFGGGWIDSLVVDPPVFNKPNHLPNCYTGFRNICQWRKWK